MGLDTVELVMSFEETFGIDIPNVVAETLETPRHVRDYVLAEYRRQGKPADSAAIFEKIRDITCEIANVRREDVTLDTTFVHDFGLD
jgi:acyl carrier protein